MPPLFVSFAGNRRGQYAIGWAVLDHGPLDDSMTIEHLVAKLEKARGYDTGTLVLTNFRRLEPSAAGQGATER